LIFFPRDFNRAFFRIAGPLLFPRLLQCFSHSHGRSLSTPSFPSPVSPVFEPNDPSLDLPCPGQVEQLHLRFGPLAGMPPFTIFAAKGLFPLFGIIPYPSSDLHKSKVAELFLFFVCQEMRVNSFLVSPFSPCCYRILLSGFKRVRPYVLPRPISFAPDPNRPPETSPAHFAVFFFCYRPHRLFLVRREVCFR